MDLNEKHKTIKLLDEHVQENPHNQGLDTVLRLSTKQKIDSLDFIKIKPFAV